MADVQTRVDAPFPLGLSRTRPCLPGTPPRRYLSKDGAQSFTLRSALWRMAGARKRAAGETKKGENNPDHGSRKGRPVTEPEIDAFASTTARRSVLNCRSGTDCGAGPWEVLFVCVFVEDRAGCRGLSLSPCKVKRQ